MSKGEIKIVREEPVVLPPILCIEANCGLTDGDRLTLSVGDTLDSSLGSGVYITAESGDSSDMVTVFLPLESWRNLVVAVDGMIMEDSAQ